WYGFDSGGLRLICSLLALPSVGLLECPPGSSNRVIRRGEMPTMYRSLDRAFHVFRQMYGHATQSPLHIILARPFCVANLLSTPLLPGASETPIGFLSVVRLMSVFCSVTTPTCCSLQ